MFGHIVVLSLSWHLIRLKYPIIMKLDFMHVLSSFIISIFSTLLYTSWLGRIKLFVDLHGFSITNCTLSLHFDYWEMR
jgi:hypothetical protein